LDTPLGCLRDIDPDQLDAFRRDYQNFRRGCGRGARGEIKDLCPDDAIPIPESSGTGASARLESSDSHGNGEDAYYSEPERDVDHGTPTQGLASRAARSAASRLVPAPASPNHRLISRIAEAVQDGQPASSSSVSGNSVFLTWLFDEVRSRPDESALLAIPRSHLQEVKMVPVRLEKLLGFGFLLCLDILLHELSFTPLQVVRALPRMLAGRLTVTEECDRLRLLLLIFNVGLIYTIFDVSAVYHYIRGESFLKLYVIFNMLEMFERFIRSVGVDLFDLIMAEVRNPWRSLAPKFVVTLIYCFLHTVMHYLRVLLLSVAINTSSSAVWLILVTNNFGEIKSTVFKKYKEDSLFPIVTSDIVERFYLVLDIIFVLTRQLITPHRAMMSALDIATWLVLLVLIEIGTDWIKFCLILKFSELNASMIDKYKDVMTCYILKCRSHILGAGVESSSG
jgi:hypothetical protein